MPGSKIVIVDYGMGNLHTVLYKIKKLQPEVIISSSREDIASATKIILPGVGHFAAGMKRINEIGIREVLDKKALTEKIPVMGICLGMQLLTNFSEEGNAEGLGWINASTIRFDKQKIGSLKIPHMGWNTVALKNDPSGILNGISEESFFYFVHSFYVKCEDSSNVLCQTNYGMEFDSGIVKENIFGLQFHPEKSHDSGLAILKNFISI
jgi:imidazole glycerol-phosphate synthase subunit HisH